MKLGTIIRNNRHGKARYIYVKSDTPDTILENGGFCHGTCINCVSSYNSKKLYRPNLCNLCNPHDGNRGHWQLYSIGRLSREKIVYKIRTIKSNK